MGDEQIKQYIKDGVLTVPYGQKKAVLAWLSDQFNLLKPDWDNPEVKFDSKLARKVVILGIDKIHVEYNVNLLMKNNTINKEEIEKLEEDVEELKNKFRKANGASH